MRINLLGFWLNDQIPPVLKHGPRSLSFMRVFGCKTPRRNESERRLDLFSTEESAQSTDPDLLGWI